MTRRGFTLIEVLVAAALVAVLMAGVWALMSTFERLFNSGQARAEQAQISRTLLAQLAEDLRTAIPDSASAAPGATTAVRRFGLFGTEQAMQVDVLQVSADQCLVAAGRTELVPGGKPLQVPELKTVQYSFTPPGIEAELLGEQGFVRRELDWESPPAGSSSESAEDAATTKRLSGPRRSSTSASATTTAAAGRASGTVWSGSRCRWRSK
jgi:prepilin-type N-terminal cleavage/methylation domain-containing protein